MNRNPPLLEMGRPMGIIVLAWLVPVGLAVKSSGGSSSSGKEIAGTCPLPADAVSGVSNVSPFDVKDAMTSSWCSAQTLLRRSACERSGCVARGSDQLRRIRQRGMGLRRSR